MTILDTHEHRDGSAIEEFLIKNLPNKIKAGNHKEYSNINEYCTIVALKRCKFMNFNSTARISIMVFDIDEVDGMTAKEYFKDIDGLLDFITNKIEMEPTYILETDKGFHFGFGLKNHVFTNQIKATTYLRTIKKALGELLECDANGSNRLNGIWRNPLLHPHYFSGEFNYELKDFSKFLPQRTWHKRKNSVAGFDIDKVTFPPGKRNNNLFYVGMVYADALSELSEDNIFQYLMTINKEKQVGLEELEIKTIAISIYKYWSRGEICLKRGVNVGMMNFKKIKNLSREDYIIEVKKRQQKSAIRTLDIRDKEKNKSSLKKAKRKRINQLAKANTLAINKAIKMIEKEKKKVTFVAVAKYSKLDRRTVAKYMKMD